MKKDKRCAILGITNEGLYAALLYAQLGYEVVLFDQDDKKVEQYARGWISWSNEKWKEQFAAHRSQFHFMKIEEFLSVDVSFYALTDQEQYLVPWYAFFAEIKQKKVSFLLHTLVPVGMCQKIYTLLRYFAPHASLIYWPFFLDGQQENDHLPWLIGCQNDEDHLFMSLLLMPYLSAKREWIYSDFTTVECAAHMYYDYQKKQQIFINEWSKISTIFHADHDVLHYFLKLADSPMPPVQEETKHFEKNEALMVFWKEVFSHISPSVLKEEDITTRIWNQITMDFPSLPHAVAILGVCPMDKQENIDRFYALPLVQRLLQENIIVHIYDPRYLHLFKSHIRKKKNIIYASSVSEAIHDVDLILLLTEEEEWKSLSSMCKTYALYKEYV